MAVAVGPGPELLEDPCRLAGGRVDEAVAERLRPGRLLLGVARVPLGVVLAARRGRAAPRRVGSPSSFGRAPIARVTWIAGAVLGVGARRSPWSPPSPSRRPGRRSGRSRGRPSVVRQRVARSSATPQPVVGRLAGEAEAGQRRGDDVEGVRGVAAVRGRVGERLDHLVELDDRARPAVGDQQRQRVGWGERTWMKCSPASSSPSTGVVNWSKRLSCGLAGPPVVAVGPVLADVLDVGQRRALRPVVDQFALGPAGVAQAGRRSSSTSWGTSMVNGSIRSTLRPVHLRNSPGVRAQRAPGGEFRRWAVAVGGRAGEELGLVHPVAGGRAGTTRSVSSTWRRCVVTRQKSAPGRRSTRSASSGPNPTCSPDGEVELDADRRRRALEPRLM